jgi:hypothetical protein
VLTAVAIVEASGGKSIVVVFGVELEGLAEAFEVARAGEGVGLVAGATAAGEGNYQQKRDGGEHGKEVGARKRGGRLP